MTIGERIRERAEGEGNIIISFIGNALQSEAPMP